MQEKLVSFRHCVHETFITWHNLVLTCSAIAQHQVSPIYKVTGGREIYTFHKFGTPKIFILQVGRHDYVSNLVTVCSMRSSPHMRKILY